MCASSSSRESHTATLTGLLEQQAETQAVKRTAVVCDLMHACLCRLLPTPVVGLDGVTVVKVGCGWRHSVAVSNAGRLYTFGWSKYGQLGHGDNS
jgi:alpha-tubulin suppressor-like RCC1 family protein